MARKSEEWRHSGLDEDGFIDRASTHYAVTEERTIPTASPGSDAP